MLFSNAQNIRVLSGCFETIFWNAYHDQLWIQRLLNTLPCFHSKRFQLLGLKLCKKLKISFFKSSVVHLLLTSRKFQNHFLKRFLCPTSDLHSFVCFALLSPKSFSTCSLKNVQRNSKIHFQTLRVFVFDFKVASKDFWNFWQTLKWNHFGGSHLLFLKTVSTSFPENLQKMWKISHLNLQSHCFSPSGSFKIIF